MSIKSIKAKVIDKTSTFIADKFMGGDKAKKSIAKTNAYLEDKKLVKATKGLEPYPNNDYTSPVFRARANVSAYEAEYANKMRKANR